ncbi:MAG: NTF2 fold immunity protein [Acidobacteriaceae bacterium]|jgi:hypothetical protein
MKLLASIWCATILLGVGFGQQFSPPGGFVPNEATAVKVAEAVLVPVYGEQQIASERPFHARRDGDTWTVSGTLRCPDGKGGTTTTLCDGGVAEVHISAADARILSMKHGK